MSAQAMGQAWPLVGDLPPRQALVLLAVADVVNDAHNNRFWMASTALAAKAGGSRATAAAALARFVKDGLLEVVTPSDGHRPTEYRWLGSVQNLDTSEASSPAAEVSRTGDGSVQTSGRARITNPREPKEPKARALAPFEAEFNDAWQHYPRKVARQAALKAWQARRRQGWSPTEMTVAAVHYAASRHGEDPAFTMHGATFWGPSERWRDYAHGPPPGAVARPQESRKQREDRELAERIRQAQERERFNGAPLELTP